MIRLHKKPQKSTWTKRMAVWSYLIVLGLVKSAMKQEEKA